MKYKANCRFFFDKTEAAQSVFREKILRQRYSENVYGPERVGNFSYNVPHVRRQNEAYVLSIFIGAKRAVPPFCNLEYEFNKLASQWKKETSFVATALEIVVHNS